MSSKSTTCYNKSHKSGVIYGKTHISHVIGIREWEGRGGERRGGEVTWKKEELIKIGQALLCCCQPARCLRLTIPRPQPGLVRGEIIASKNRTLLDKKIFTVCGVPPNASHLTFVMRTTSISWPVPRRTGNPNLWRAVHKSCVIGFPLSYGELPPSNFFLPSCWALLSIEGAVSYISHSAWSRQTPITHQHVPRMMPRHASKQ